VPLTTNMPTHLPTRPSLARYYPVAMSEDAFIGDASAKIEDHKLITLAPKDLLLLHCRRQLLSACVLCAPAGSQPRCPSPSTCLPTHPCREVTMPDDASIDDASAKL
jgi:hypothetical protein